MEFLISLENGNTENYAQAVRSYPKVFKDTFETQVQNVCHS